MIGTSKRKNRSEAVAYFDGVQIVGVPDSHAHCHTKQNAHPAQRIFLFDIKDVVLQFFSCFFLAIMFFVINLSKFCVFYRNIFLPRKIYTRITKKTRFTPYILIFSILYHIERHAWQDFF